MCHRHWWHLIRFDVNTVHVILNIMNAKYLHNFSVFVFVYNEKNKKMCENFKMECEIEPSENLNHFHFFPLKLHEHFLLFQLNVTFSLVSFVV